MPVGSGEGKIEIARLLEDLLRKGLGGSAAATSVHPSALNDGVVHAGSFVRFAVHLFLYLWPNPQGEARRIGDSLLQAYISYLAREGMEVLIPQYASYLSDSVQIDLYAAFLRGIPDMDKRKHYLGQAKEWLPRNCARITQRMVDSILDQDDGSRERGGQQVSQQEQQQQQQQEQKGSPGGGDQWNMGTAAAIRARASATPRQQRRDMDLDEEPSSHRASAMRAESNGTGHHVQWHQPTKQDHEKIDAVMCMDLESDSAAAIASAAQLYRFFVGHDKLPAAVALWQSLQKLKLHRRGHDLEVDADLLRQFHSWSNYARCIRWFFVWSSHVAAKPSTDLPTAPARRFDTDRKQQEAMVQAREQLARWTQRRDSLVEQAFDSLRSTLQVPGGWLLGSRAGFGDASDADLSRLRHKCIPQMFLLMHRMCVESGRFEKSLELGVLLASDRYKLYRGFSRSELVAFLSRLSATQVQCEVTGLRPRPARRPGPGSSQ